MLASIEAPIPRILEYQLDGFSQPSYDKGVRALFHAFEATSNKTIHPGPFKKVGLKVYTRSGLGLATPKNLVQAVIQELIQRGYKRENIFIVDELERFLRVAQFLPPIEPRRPLFSRSPCLCSRF